MRSGGYHGRWRNSICRVRFRAQPLWGVSSLDLGRPSGRPFFCPCTLDGYTAPLNECTVRVPNCGPYEKIHLRKVRQLATAAVPCPFRRKIAELPVAPVDLGEFAIELTANIAGGIRNRRIRRCSALVVRLVQCLGESDGRIVRHRWCHDHQGEGERQAHVHDG